MKRRQSLHGRENSRACSRRARIELECLEERTLLSRPLDRRREPVARHPPSVWDISGAGDPTIQGFATDISVNTGRPSRFKIDDRRDAATTSTSTAWATTAGTAPARSRRSPVGRRLPQVQPPA